MRCGTSASNFAANELNPKTRVNELAAARLDRHGSLHWQLKLRGRVNELAARLDRHGSLHGPAGGLLVELLVVLVELVTASLILGSWRRHWWRR